MSIIQVDEQVILQLLKDAAQEKIEQVSAQLTFWNMADLKRQTGIKTTATLKEYFFYDPNFPKFKIGRDWYFPVKEAQAYLEKYALVQMEEQRSTAL